MAFGADKDLHPLGLAARVQEAQHGLLGLQHLEQRPQPFEIGQGGHVPQQVCLAAYDQRALAVAAGPAGDAGCDDPMVLYLYARASFGVNDPGPEEALRRARTAAQGLAASRYPAIRRAVALSVSGLAASKRSGSNS